MKYTDADMKMMALGEIGAHFVAILAAVASWLYLGEVTVLLKVPVALVALLVAWKMSVAFVHMGYVPEEQEGDG